MIELINGIHHYPFTTYRTDDAGNVVADEIYPHRAQTRNVAGWEEFSDLVGPGGRERAGKWLAKHLNQLDRLAGARVRVHIRVKGLPAETQDLQERIDARQAAKLGPRPTQGATTATAIESAWRMFELAEGAK